MIVVTGAAGFIGSCLISRLNSEGYRNIVAVDDFSSIEKRDNLEGKNLQHQVERDTFIEWSANYVREIDFIFHLGARTDTTEFDMDLLSKLNTEYSKKIWSLCTEHQIPLVYASSAATYGGGENGYSDSTSPEKLEPLNPYGVSKNEFDKWVLKNRESPFFWAGLKFFNVYGPNEYHKGRMASVVSHAYNQIKDSGKMKLFRSHNSRYKDGEQIRDFIYVKDVLDVCCWFMENRKHSGIYNLGSGQGRTFNDLVESVFTALKKKAQIEYIDTPEDIRDRYQYFTEAEMDKLRSAGYEKKFYELEEGVGDYVTHYLLKDKNY